MTTLPEPDFIARDAAEVLRESVAFVEAQLGRPIDPDQLERLMVDLIVYREMILREQMQEACKQNLVAFSRYPMIDYLCAMVGIERLPASKARVPLVFAFSAPLDSPLPIPEGFRIRTQDAKVTFATVAAVTLAAGSTGVTLTGECVASGAAGNGFAPGQISEPLDALAVAFTVSNSDVSAGGGPSEDTERLRARFPSSVRALSVAGPFSAYEHLARSASADVLDVQAVSLVPLVMTMFVLAVGGEPSEGLLELVDSTLDPVTGRPALDEVEVIAATPREWALEVELVLRRSRTGVVETAEDLAAAELAAEQYASELRQGLRRSVVVSQVFSRFQLPNVYSVDVIQPSSGVECADGEWAECTSIMVSVVGYEGDP